MKKIPFLLAAALVLALSCSKDEIVNVEGGGGSGSDAVADTDYDSTRFDCAVAVVFSPTGSATVTGTTDSLVATVAGNGVTIVNSGSSRVQYNISGSSSDGYLKIYSAKRQALVLDGVSLANSNGAAINVQGPQASPNSGKATYIVVRGTNSVADGGSYNLTPSSEDEKAAIFSEGQILLGGSGTLNVTASGKAGVTSDDYLKVYDNVTLHVSSSAGHGLRGKDSVLLAGGTVDVTVSANGKKGISTDGSCVVTGGTVTVTTTGNTVVVDGDTNKVACVKADGDFRISGGSLTLTASGTGAKGISCDGTGTFAGGTVHVTVTGANFGSGSSGGGGHPGPGGGGRGGSSNGTGSKGIKCDGAITVTGGTLYVNQSTHEGIESKSTITVTGGEVYSYSTGDDAINSKGVMTIDGGMVYAHSAGNDGLDANDNLYIAGGLVYAITTRGTPEVAIDALEQRTLYIQGGTLIAVGGLERGASLQQDCYKVNTWSKNTWYTLTTGGTSYAFKTPNGGNSLIVSGPTAPELKNGATVDGGTEVFGGMLKTGVTVSGGTALGTSRYTGSAW